MNKETEQAMRTEAARLAIEERRLELETKKEEENKLKADRLEQQRMLAKEKDIELRREERLEEQRERDKDRELRRFEIESKERTQKEHIQAQACAQNKQMEANIRLMLEQSKIVIAALQKK